MLDTEHLPARERLTFGPFSLSPSERLLEKDGAPLEIGGRSFDLLVILTEQPGRVLSKRELLKRVWSDVVVDDGSLRFHMAGLRKLLGEGTDGARYIATQVGVGYAFVAPVERQRLAEADRPPRLSRTDPDDVVAIPVATNLPARLTRLFGREADLALLQARVSETPLFTIVGPAGVGKTSLAIEIAHSVAPRFDGQIAFVDFGMLENPDLVPAMIAGAMGISVHSDDPLAVIRGHLRERHFLLLLDNCEHVIEPAAYLVERLLKDAPQLRILATSREPLRVREEHVHRLEALSYPDDVTVLTLDQLVSYPAVQLFCERAVAADSSTRIDEDTARLIATMCQRLDGMALPIELAAVRAATHGISVTAQQIGERFSLGWQGRRTAVRRQQTLQATLDWSYELLSQVERIVLEQLSVFVGPFSIDAALAVIANDVLVSDEVVLAVDELISKSLISPDRARRTGTYRLLEMTRAYARQRLTVRGQGASNEASCRHARFFLAELEGLAALPTDLPLDSQSLRQQLGNIRSALDWAFGREGDRDIGVRLAAASAPIFQSLSHLIECRTWCGRGVADLDPAQRGTALELELQGALGLSLMFTRGNSDAAGGALSRALEIATSLDDHWSRLRILGRLHIFHERIGNYEIAMNHARNAVEVAALIGDDEALGVAYSLAGISHHLAGDQIRAREELELSLANAPPSERSRTVHYGFDHRNRSSIALARTLWLMGEPGKAEALARQTVRTAALLDHPVTHCIALIWSLAVHTWIGNLAAAEEALDAFTACAEINALGPYIAAASGFRGELAILRQETRDAVGSVEESLARLRAARYELLTTSFSIAIARGLILESRMREASDVLHGSIARCSENGEQFAMPELLRIKAEVLVAEGHTLQAANVLEEAAGLARSQGSLAWELRATTDLASMLAELGKPAEAEGRLDDVMKRFAPFQESADMRRAGALAERLRREQHVI